jgi:soluble lytic murein transglycosylase
VAFQCQKAFWLHKVARMDAIRKHNWWLFGIIFVVGLIALWNRWRTWRENSQDQYILAAAQRYAVDPALIKAVVWRESRFNPKARGDAGEIGLMQIGDLAAREWARAEKIPAFVHHDLFDPAKNTLCGTWYLRKLIGRYGHTDNPLAYALADYNAGRTRVLKWISGGGSTNSAVFLAQMDFSGTRNYVRSILKRYAQYRPIFPAQRSSSHPGKSHPSSAESETRLKVPVIADKRMRQ